jgi:hypothetical protein
MKNASVKIYCRREDLPTIKTELDRLNCSFEEKQKTQLAEEPPSRLIPKEYSACVSLCDSSVIVDDNENYFQSDSNACTINDLSLRMGEKSVEFLVAIGLSSGHRTWVSLELSTGGLYHALEHFEPVNPGVVTFPSKGVLLEFHS